MLTELRNPGKKKTLKKTIVKKRKPKRINHLHLGLNQGVLVRNAEQLVVLVLSRKFQKEVHLVLQRQEKQFNVPTIFLIHLCTTIYHAFQGQHLRVQSVQIQYI